jgi:hypothetical protein
MIHIKIIMHIIVCEYFSFNIRKLEIKPFSSDYDQSGRGGNGAPWYYDKQNKRKKKIDGPLGVDPNSETGDATSK